MDGRSPLAVFSSELRHYRTRAQLSQDQLGEKIQYSGKTVAAVENGHRRPTEDFASRCDAALGTGGALTRLRELLRDQMQQQAWPVWFRDWPAIEREADALHSWEPAVIPGLLQTGDYARAILTAALPDEPAERIEEHVEARLQRQEIFQRKDAPLFCAVMDESVLRRPVGSREIMAAQLDQLLAAAARNRTTVLIVPASAGAHIGLSGAFAVAQFHEAASVSYLDTAAQGQITSDPATVRRCVRACDRLQAESLPPRVSAGLISEVRNEWT